MKDLSIFSLLFLMACGTQEKAPEEEIKPQCFYVGTYTDKDSRGIYQYELSEQGQMKQIGLMAVAENPSFLVTSYDGKYLVAVNEISNKKGHGSVESYAIGKDSLLLVNRKSSGGAHPCFVAMNEEGYVLAANYSGGNLCLLKLDEQGTLHEMDLEQHKGMGTTSRQEAPHVHSAWFSPWNHHIISADLGTNELWFSKIEEGKLIALESHKLAMEEGAGPRHLCFHPTELWLYVLNELNSTVTQVELLSDGIYQTRSTTSTLSTDYTGDNYSADIRISSDGRFVYASNRGPNTMAIFEVDGENGQLSLLSNTSTKGDWPRNFCFSPDENYLLVAHQYSNNISCFKRDPQTGLLEFVSEVAAPSPVCLLF